MNQYIKTHKIQIVFFKIANYYNYDFEKKKLFGTWTES